MPRRLPSIGEQVGLGVAAGLAVSLFLGPEFALPLALAGGAAGVWRSFRRTPDAPVCRIWRIFGGCGGSTTVADKRGNTGPPVRCWGHPESRPKRWVNLVVVPAQLAVVVVLLFVAAVVVAGQPPG